MGSGLAEEVLRYIDKGQGNHDLVVTSPHVLYLSDAQADNYLEAMDNEDYSGFHSETTKLIEKHAGEIVGHPKGLYLVDLGPGFPDKAIPLGEYCRRAGVALSYCAVDVSEKFLRIATQEMKKYASQVKAVNSLFENAAPLIPEATGDKLVMLGLTFMNFESAAIVKVLRQLAGCDGSILVAAQFVDGPAAIDPIIKQYETTEARAVAFGPLCILGIKEGDVVYHVEFAHKRIEMSFEFKTQPPKVLRDRGLSIGGRILTAISHRWTTAELEEILRSQLPEGRLRLWTLGSTALAHISLQK